MLQGFCSKCHKVWTLERPQGVCQWCGKLTTCQTRATQALRSIKSRSNGRKRQAPSNSNGYDQLEGDWALYYKVAKYFVHKVKVEDSEDFLHDLLLEMAKVKAKYQVTGKPLTEAGLMRVASYQVTEYWTRLRRLTTWLDCGNCSKEQRRKCREEDLYRECPKFRELLYLDKELDDGNSGKFTLAEFIADDKALDLDAWLDARRILRGLPKRLVQIGYKRYRGYDLTHSERNLLVYYLKKTQKPLF